MVPNKVITKQYSGNRRQKHMIHTEVIMFTLSYFGQSKVSDVYEIK